MTEDVDSFAEMFGGPPGETQRIARAERARKERRTQLTKKQRQRGGVRTAQINYRCSPAYKELVMNLANRLNCSVADLMEEMASVFVEAKGLDGEMNA